MNEPTSPANANETANASETANRLGSTLFLMALAHGVVILGITFSGAVSEPLDTSTLKVTLVSPRSLESTDEAAFIANQTQSGGSDETDSLRPTAVVSTFELANIDGDHSAADLRDTNTRPADPSANQIATSASSDSAVTVDATEDIAQAAVAERAQTMHSIEAPQTLAAIVDLTAGLPANDDSDPVLGPSTVQSVLADYLNAWRERVERIGTLNFPSEFLVGNSATRRPRLEVAIGSDGNLRDIIVQETSGDRAVDQAAVSILRLAAPFAPLPPEILAEYNPLRFAYEWDFIQADR